MRREVRVRRATRPRGAVSLRDHAALRSTVVRELTPGKREIEHCQLLDGVTHVERRQARETPHEQPSAGEYDDGQRDLRGDQHLSHTAQTTAFCARTVVCAQRR